MAMVSAAAVVFATLTAGGCAGKLPSADLDNGFDVPVPAGDRLDAGAVDPSIERTATGPAPSVSREAPGSYVLTPLNVIHMAFNRNPQIKETYQIYKAEEARYDFFYTSRDSFTPGMRVSNRAAELREPELRERDTTQSVELFVEKRFFSTSKLDLRAGYTRTDKQWDAGQSSHPFVGASLRYPLSTSREALQRASDQIIRQNDLNSAKTRYLQVARSRLRWALINYYEAIELRDRLTEAAVWLDDLRELATEIERVKGGDANGDLTRVQAEIATVEAQHRDIEGSYSIQIDVLKARIGLPFDAQFELRYAAFNPFEDVSQQELYTLSIATDPEILTLGNSVRNAQVQLDLARRGKWDAAVIVSGSSSLEGDADARGYSWWEVSTAFELRAVDERVTTSLEREGLANIERFQQAIRSRKDDIYVDTIDPLVRIRTGLVNIEQLSGNLDRWVRDYDQGMVEYRNGRLNIDDLLTRRQTLFDQRTRISSDRRWVGSNVARLCAATGRFFDLLKADPPDVGTTDVAPPDADAPDIDAAAPADQPG